MSEQEILDLLRLHFEVVHRKTRVAIQHRDERIRSAYNTDRIAKIENDRLLFTIGETELGERVGLSDSIQTIITDAGLPSEHVESTDGSAPVKKRYVGFRYQEASRTAVERTIKRVLDAVEEGRENSSAIFTKPHTSDEPSEAVPPAEGHDGILVVRGSGTHRAWNNIRYKTGLSAKNVGAKKLSMNVATIPPGGVAYAHVHVEFEVMLYILEGRVRHEYGPNLRHSVENGPGDFIFIEPGVPHEVFNMSDTEPVVAVVARSDASEWENIVDYDRETGQTRPRRT